MQVSINALNRSKGASIGLALLLSACAVDNKTGAQSFAGVKISDDPCAKTATVAGSVIGGVIGGLLGKEVSNQKNAPLVGAAAGAAIGGLIGRDIDRRRCELFKIAQKHNVEISIAAIAVPEGALPPPGGTNAPNSREQGAAGSNAGQGSGGRSVATGLTMSVRDTGNQFAAGSDQLLPQARAYFADVAEQYAYGKQAAKLGGNASKEDRDAIELLRSKRILLIGHTDDTGSSRGNADLSERRAMAVAKVFRDQGISDSQLFYQGAGETLPIADNQTETGRAQNRRVEIVDVTDDSAFHKFLATRTQRVEFYRGAPPAVAVAAATPQPTSPASPANPPPTRPAVPPPNKPLGDTQRPPAASPGAAAPAPVARLDPPAIGLGGASTFDFGGTPASTTVATADIGREIAPKPGFSLISTAYASGGPVVPTCSTDRPRVSNGVKSLRDQKDISVTEYMPGLYNTSWMDNVNGNLVGLSNVAVLRDGGAPARKPNLLIYKGYKAGSGAKPDFNAQPEVNAYRGDKAILYRVFVDGPVKCMDVVFPYDNSGEARNSNLFYEKQGSLFVAAFRPKLAR